MSVYDDNVPAEPSLEDEEGHYSDEVITMGEADVRLCAELVAFLEDEMSIDLKRIQIMARGGCVSIQGTVDSEDIRKECEVALRERPGVKELDSSLQVQDMTDWE